jgi:hypothetical protein
MAEGGARMCCPKCKVIGPCKSIYDSAWYSHEDGEIDRVGRYPAILKTIFDNEKVKVAVDRVFPSGFWRTRECQACGEQFYTDEIAKDKLVEFIKEIIASQKPCVPTAEELLEAKKVTIELIQSNLTSDLNMVSMVAGE